MRIYGQKVHIKYPCHKAIMMLSRYRDGFAHNPYTYAMLITVAFPERLQIVDAFCFENCPDVYVKCFSVAVLCV